jgi:hypothetical protein
VNFVLNWALKYVLGWAEDEVQKNGNRIKVGIAGALVAGAIKLVGLFGGAVISPALMPAVTQFADWAANLVLGGAGSLIAAWTVRAPGVTPPPPDLPPPPADALETPSVSPVVQ